MNPKRDCSLVELANKAGVNISTVSRALNGSPLLSEKRITEIRKLAESMGYRPQPLRTKRKNAIGLIIASSKESWHDDDFQSRVSLAVMHEMEERKIHLNVESGWTASSAKEGNIPELVRQNRVDGIILACHPDKTQVEALKNLGIPTVALNDTVSRLGVPCVSNSPYNAVKEAVKTLAAQGHEKIAMFNTKLEFPTVRARSQAYSDAMDEIGMSSEKLEITGLATDISGGRNGVRQLKQEKKSPSAIICCNDWMALGAMTELQINKIRVPQDVSVIGYGDLPLCTQLEPQLSTISCDLGKIVSMAVDLLMDEIEGKTSEAQDYTINGHMIWRQSSGLSPSRSKSK